MKSLIKHGHLPKYNAESSKAWLYLKLLVGFNRKNDALIKPIFSLGISHLKIIKTKKIKKTKQKEVCRENILFITQYTTSSITSYFI